MHRFIGLLTVLTALSSVAGEGDAFASFIRANETRKPKPEPVELVLSGKLMGQYVEITGSVQDVFRDETNPDYIWLVLDCDNQPVYAATFDAHATGSDLEQHLCRLVGAVVALRGGSNNSVTTRPYRGITFEFRMPDGLSVIKSAPKDPYDLPALEQISTETPPLLIQHFGRHQTSGRVVARWGGVNLLVKTSVLAPFVRVELSDAKPPAVGQWVQVAGRPETDTHNLNLSQAIWRPSAPGPDETDAPLAVSARQILADDRGTTHIKPEYHGRTIRLSGTVQTRFLDSPRILLADGDALVPVELGDAGSAFDSLTPDTEVELTGVCVMDIENCRPSATMPIIKGFFLVVRSDADVRVLSRPPWWTAGRLRLALLLAFAALLAIFVWNLALRRLVERRTHALVDEELKSVRADLRAEERTRIAVELHDSLAQSLGGVALEVATAAKLGSANPPAMRRHLDIAESALQSCNDELRNCLWDLRNQALDEPELDRAIVRTLQPHIHDARLAVRFNVPRTVLSDSMTHTVLRIIRELVINALRHGKAEKIRVAGSFEDETLLFSVTDNGSGFDPDAAPGVLQGHFGLEGVRERVRRAGGCFSIKSSPGQGTRAAVTLRITSQL